VRKTTAQSTPSSSISSLRKQAIKATEAEIRYTGDRAFYRRDCDYIQMPPKTKFPNEADFYATAFHELATGARNGPVGNLTTPPMS